MNKYEYIQNFSKLGYGLFVHFGLYSVTGKGEWNYFVSSKQAQQKYPLLMSKFKVSKNWAKNLVKTAKSAGCKYITLTTRHHDGFSLYDCGKLSSYDAVHSVAKRDLVREFVDECNKNDIVPFFYHTLLDWSRPEFENDFNAYIDYLCSSVEILCKNYGKIGGFWFDGTWSKPNNNWQEDRLYGLIRKHQPTAMIINNTGLSAQGKTGHEEIDSVTFERGKPCFVDKSKKPLAGEMCQVLNDHWGYCKDDINYKSIKELVENLVDCRTNDCNFLLNIGPKANGELKLLDKCILAEIGKWIRTNKNFICNIKPCSITANNADVVTDGKYHYAIIKNVGMSMHPKVDLQNALTVTVHANIKSACWLDNGEHIETKNNQFRIEPFAYGSSYSVRVAKFEIEK